MTHSSDQAPVAARTATAVAEIDERYVAPQDLNSDV